MYTSFLTAVVANSNLCTLETYPLEEAKRGGWHCFPVLPFLRRNCVPQIRWRTGYYIHAELTYLKEEGVLVVLLQCVHLIHGMRMVVAVLGIDGKCMSLIERRGRG